MKFGSLGSVIVLCILLNYFRDPSAAVSLDDIVGTCLTVTKSRQVACSPGVVVAGSSAAQQVAREGPLAVSARYTVPVFHTPCAF